MSLDLSYIKAGYKSDNWKWVFSLPDKENLLLNPTVIQERITETFLLQAYGLNRYPKNLPCWKKCQSNPWCLMNILAEKKSSENRLTQQPRNMNFPIGLQNTANTCWINSALQALFHINQFKSCINSIEGFEGEESFNCLGNLLQAIFIEMDLHKNKALACSPGSIFEKLAIIVTKEIMQKDQDFEVLKCVSEFLENTIDNLLGDPRTGPQISDLFKTTLCRIARWKCTSCQKEHIRQLSPGSCYTMAAYVSADECPLDQCILDLQTETQTGVSLVCGTDDKGLTGDNGCGATVKVDRVVTPQILNLPKLLIIRNNSLVDREIRRRLHVVFPDTLDLTNHTCNHDAATFSLRAVIYHHGHWIKHFSAHVKTEGGKWYNFNDEHVTSIVNRVGNSCPLETHKNYFSVGNVASKYKNRSKVRVSRGAFIWIYERNEVKEKKEHIAPPDRLVEYVLAKQGNNQTTNLILLEKIKKERQDLFSNLSVKNIKEEFSITSKLLLSSWIHSEEIKFITQPSVLAAGMCEHKKFDPMKFSFLKCIRKNQVDNLLKRRCGIQCDQDNIPLTYSLDDALCRQCISRHCHHILFREQLKELNKQAKKESSSEPTCETTFIGNATLSQWSGLALNIYVKENGLEDLEAESALEQEKGKTTAVTSNDDLEKLEKSEVDPEHDDNVLDCKDTLIGDHGDVKPNGNSNPVSMLPSEGVNADDSDLQEENHIKQKDDVSLLFNEDIVCSHGMQDPMAAGLWIPDTVSNQMKALCKKSIHPALLRPDFNICSDCKNHLEKKTATCLSGKLERKQLYQLCLERRRPQQHKDFGKPLFLLSRIFLIEWRTYIRCCEKGDLETAKPALIDNSSLLCPHGKLLYKTLADGPLFDNATLIWEEEWNILKQYYPVKHTIEASFLEDGTLMTSVEVCKESCVEKEEVRLYEEQFNFESEVINIKQVNSVTDVPQFHESSDVIHKEENETRKRKKPRLLSMLDDGESKIITTVRTAAQRLVRASKLFSSTDTIKEVQNFIAERTGIWPLLQTLWLSGSKERGPNPLLLTDEHRSMTLNSLRIKPEETIYFRATVEDMEKAAGDGVTEYEEMEDM